MTSCDKFKMEAVPRMPMLAFELKNSSETVEFGPALKAYISEYYHEDPSSYAKECSELDQLRQSAVRISRDFTGCSTLKRYYSQLQFLQSRFPMTEEGAAAVAFTWDDLYSGRQVTQADIRFEQACVLHNIGALHSILGAVDNRQTPEGMKVSCTHFQCAAWAFQTLRDSFGESISADLPHDLLTFQINLMLAQAQECILEKSMTDHRKSSITAKVAAQIVEYYRQALTKLETGNMVGSKRFKEWKKRLELKSNFHQCVMYLYLGYQSEEQQKWGERVAYYTAALDRLNDCVKLARNEEEDIEEALRFTMDVVGGKCNAAKKDNDFVYHDKVPDLDSLPEVKGASLVKGIPFNPADPEVSGPDVFQRLVPMEAHAASSLYSEEKAKLLRRIGGQIEEKNNELSEFMSLLQLDPSILTPEPDKVPQVLLEKCAAISVRPNAIKDLVKAMQDLSSIATDVEGNIAEIQGLLKEEYEHEKEYQQRFGKRATLPALPEIEKDCTKYQEGLQVAAQSNQELHRAMNVHISNLKLLSGPLDELKHALPSVERSRTPEEDEVRQEVKRLLGKIDEMQKQRDTLEQQFRDQVHQDDITSILVTRDDCDHETFFQEQLKKHDKLTTLVEQNLTAQGNILRALTETHARFATVGRSAGETLEERENMVHSLIQSYDVYEDLLAKTQKGIDYYRRLETNVQQLLERARRVCSTQEEERLALVARHQPKGPPPSRPTAPKPNQQQMLPPGMPGIPSDISALPGMAGLPTAPPEMGGLPVSPVDGATGYKGPTLKDYLPFMKPQTFGPNAGKARTREPRTTDPYGMYAGMDGISHVPQVPMHTGSLPASLSGSPVNLPAQSASQSGSPAHLPRSSVPMDHHGQPSHPVPPGATLPGQSYGGYPMPASSGPASSMTAPVAPPAYSSLPAGAGQYAVHSTGSAGALSAPGGPGQQAKPGAPSFVAPVPGHLPVSQSQLPGAVSPQQPGHPQGGFPPRATAPGTNMDGQGAVSHPVHPGAPAGTLRLEAAHTVDSIHGPISSPGEAPSAQPQSPQGPQSQAPPLPQVQIHPGGPASGHGQYPYAMSAAAPSSLNPGSIAGGQAATTGQYSYPQGQPVQGPPRPSPVQSPAAVSTQGMQYPVAGQGATYPQGTPAVAPQQHVAPSQAHYPVGSQAGLHSAAYPTQTPGVSHAPNYASGQPQYAQQTGQAGAPGYGSTTQTVTPHSPLNSQTVNPSASQVSQQSVKYQPQPQGQYPAQAQSQYQVPQQPGTGMHTYPPQTSQPGQQTWPTPAGSQAQYSAYGYNQPSGATGTYPTNTTYPSTQPSALSSVQPAGGPGSQSQAIRASQPGYVAGQWYQQPGVPPPGQIPQGIPGIQPISQAGSTPAYRPQVPAPTATGQAVPATQRSLPTSQLPAQQAYPNGSAYAQVGASSAAGYVQQTGYSASQSQRYPAPTSTPAGTPVQHGTRPTVPQPNSQQLPGQQPSLPHQQGQYPPGQHVQTGSSAVAASQSAGTGQMLQSGGVPQQYAAQQHGPGTTNTYQQPKAPNQYYQQPQQNQAVPQPGTGYQHPAQPTKYPQQQYYNQPGQQTQQINTHRHGTAHQVQSGYSASQPQSQSQSQTQPQPPGYSATPYPQQTYPSTQPGAYPQPQQQPQQQQYQQGYPPPQQQQQPHLPHQQQVPAQQPYPQQLPQQKVPQQQPPQQPQSGYTGQPLSPLGSVPDSLPPPIQPAHPQGPSVGPLPPESGSKSNTPSPAPSPAQTPATAHRLMERQNSTSTTSSLDDILSSSPEHVRDPAKDSVLVPKVVTAEDIKQQKEEELKNSLKHVHREPYSDRAALDRFIVDVEKFEKQVEGLGKQTLSGPTPLDREWKELGDDQEKVSRKNSMAIARCYPLKNRDQDIMPYDTTRVILSGVKDDYINASNIGDLSPSCPKVIASQAPLPATVTDYWQMVYEQGTEVIVMLASETEPGKQRLHQYWPAEKGQSLQYGPFLLTAQTVQVKASWTQRIIHLTHHQSHQTRIVVHLQFPNWPPSGTPESPGPLLQFISEVHSFYIQQRSLMKPVIVHCSNGVGRTGAFCAIYTGMQEINHGNGLVEVVELVQRLRCKRKYMVQEKEQLRFIYHAILYHAQDLLMKRGILTNKASFGDKLPSPGDRHGHQRKPSEDFILGTTTSLSAIQSTVAKMGQRTTSSQPHSQSATDTSGEDQNSSTGDSAFSASAAAVAVAANGLENSQEVTCAESVAVPADSSALAAPGEPRQTEPGDPGSGIPQTHSDTGSSTSSQPPSHPSSTHGSHSPSPKHQPAGMSNLPPSLADLEDPNLFSLDSPGSKRKITKANFMNKTTSITDATNDPTDPLSFLDPMWTMKDNKS